MTQAQSITKAQALQQILSDLKGTTFTSIDMSTEVDLLGGAKNPMKGHIRKVTKGGNVMIFGMKQGSAYDNMVKRRMAQEGLDPTEFVLKPRKWGTRVDGTPFIEHNEATYIEVFFVHPGTSHYELDGKLIDAADIEGLKPARTKGADQQGGIENEIMIRTIKCENILAIRADGNEHTL